jgi:hypothetical protein
MPPVPQLLFKRCLVGVLLMVLILIGSWALAPMHHVPLANYFLLPGILAQVCNPSYTRGRVRKDQGFGPACTES